MRFRFVVLIIFFILATTALDAFAARKFTVERVKRTGMKRWTCKDGSATGLEETRSEARKAGKAACGGTVIVSDPTGPAIQIDVLYMDFSHSFVANLFDVPDDTRGSDASGNGTAVEVAGLLPLSEVLSLHVGFFYGSGEARQNVILLDGPTVRRGVQTTDLDLFGGEAAVRLYPLESDRLQPWFGLGVSESFGRPHGGRIDLVDGTTVALGSVENTRETSGFATAGMDFRWSETFRATLGGQYAQPDSWSARIGVGFSIGARR